MVELRRSLQQSKVESQFLQEELRKAAGPSAPAAHVMEEKIQLLKEVRFIYSFISFNLVLLQVCVFLNTGLTVSS